MAKDVRRLSAALIKWKLTGNFVTGQAESFGYWELIGACAVQQSDPRLLLVLHKLGGISYALGKLLPIQDRHLRKGQRWRKKPESVEKSRRRRQHCRLKTMMLSLQFSNKSHLLKWPFIQCCVGLNFSIIEWKLGCWGLRAFWIGNCTWVWNVDSLPALFRCEVYFDSLLWSTTSA